MRFQPLRTARGEELAPRAGDSAAVIHIPTSASFYGAAIEGLARLDEEILSVADFPPLYESGVRYRKESPDTWRHVDDLLATGWGDCEDLSAWRVAELRVSGVDPDAHVYVYRSGPRRYHAVVARGDGTIEDPSLRLGMRVSAERRAQMPRHEGENEGYRDPSRFGDLDYSAIGDDGSTLMGPFSMRSVFRRARRIGRAGLAMPFAAARMPLRLAKTPAQAAMAMWAAKMRGDPNVQAQSVQYPSDYSPEEAESAGLFGVLGYEDFGDDGRLLGFCAEGYEDDAGGEDDEDEGDDEDEEQSAEPDEEEEEPTPRRKKRRKKKKGGGPKEAKLIRGVRLVGKGAQMATSLATKAAILPLKAVSKLTRFFMGVEGDDAYVVGDENLFSTPPETPEELHEAPESQRLRIDTQEVAPKVFGAKVTLPLKTEPGKAITMTTTPSSTDKAAMEKAGNLIKTAAQSKALQLAVSPQALVAMMAVKAAKGASSPIVDKLRQHVKFV